MGSMTTLDRPTVFNRQQIMSIKNRYVIWTIGQESVRRTDSWLKYTSHQMGRIKQLRTRRKAYKRGKARFTAQNNPFYIKRGSVEVLITLDIPAGAQLRYGDASHRWRVSRARVEKIEFVGPRVPHGQYPWKLVKFTSTLNPDFEYKVGSVVKPTKPFDEDPENVSGAGIHCFGSRNDALKHQWRKE